MRKIGIALLVIIVLVVGGLLVLPRLVNVDQYHGRVQAELQKRLGREVQLGKMHLSLLPLAFRVEKAVIGEDPAFKSQRAFAEVEELRVSARLLPLLRGEIEVDAVELRRPMIELIRNQQGVWNFASLGHQATPPAEAGPQQPPDQQAPPDPGRKQQEQEAKSKPREFSLDELRIVDGQLAITDFQKHQSRAIYDHIDVLLEDFAPGKPFSLRAAAHLPGEGAQTVELDGRGGPIDSANLIGTPFEGTLKLDEVSLAAVQKFFNSPALQGTDARISGEAEVRNRDAKLASKGSLRLENPKLRGVDVGYPIQADYDITDDLTTDIIQIARADIKLGDTPLSARGTVNTRANPMQLDVQLKASNASISEMARLAAAFGVAFNPGMKVDGRVTADVHATGAANQPALNGGVTAKDLNISGPKVPQPVRVNAVQLTLTPQQVRSNEFTATAGSTSVNVAFALAQYASPQPVVDATVKTNNAKLDELLHIAQAYGLKATEGMSGSGNVSLNVQAKGPVKDANALALSGSGKLANASIQLPSLTKPVSISNADLQFTRNAVVLNNVALAAGKTSASGNVTVRNFAAPQVQFALAANTVDVAELQAMLPEQQQPQPAPKTGSLGLAPQAHAQAAGEPSIVTRMTGGGSFTANKVFYDKLTFENVRGKVTLDRGVVRVSPLTAQLYGGEQAGAVVIDMRRKPATYSVDSRLRNVQANDLLSATTSLKDKLYGLLASSADTNFIIVSGGTSEQIARSLNGSLSVDLSRGRLAGMNLLQQLGQVANFLRGAPQAGEPHTSILGLKGNFDVKNGVARTNDLKLTLDGGSVAAAGAIDLATQQLDLRMTAVLSRGMSQAVGGTQVGGFMQTALANRNGELVIPVIVSGTLGAPKFAPDAEKIARMKLENMVPSLANPADLTTGILGAIGGREGEQKGGIGGILGTITGRERKEQQQQPQQPVGEPQQQPQQEPKGAVEEIIDLFGGKKKDEQKQQQPEPQEQPK